MSDIEIKENSKETLCFVRPMTSAGKEFLAGQQTTFQGMYRWTDSNNVGYAAEERGLTVKWAA
jgi:hypothetical protein